MLFKYINFVLNPPPPKNKGKIAKAELSFLGERRIIDLIIMLVGGLFCLISA